MKEIEKIIEEAQKRIDKKIKVITEKTSKKIIYSYEFAHPYIKMEDKKVLFTHPGALETYIDGMYQIAKDL